MPAAECRELLIEDLNAELLETEASLVEALRDRDGYRLLASAALEQLHVVHERERRHLEARARLVDELRRLRGFLMRQDQERAA